MNVIGIIVVIGFACFAMGFILILAKILKALPRTNEGSVKLTNLNKKQKKLVDSAKASLEPVKKGKPKIAIKQEDPISEQKVYYISFNGDVMAKAVDNLKEEVNVILDVAKAGDEVLITLESPGGVVDGYGLSAAQI
jgi:serine protease SohB